MKTLKKIFENTLQDAINLQKSGAFVFDSNYERDSIISTEFLMRAYIYSRKRKVLWLMILFSAVVGVIASGITYLILLM